MPDELINNLTEMQEDAIKEIGNVGAGNAATAFAEFLDCKIDMTVPSVEILPIQNVPEITGDISQKVVGILMQVTGNAPGHILFVLTQDSVKHLLNLIITREIDTGEFNEVEISALKEIGNILSGSYLSSLNQMTGLDLAQSVPAFAYDMAGAILSSSMVPLTETSDYALLIETQFIDGGHEIEGYFFFIPEPGSLRLILQKLGFDV